MEMSKIEKEMEKEREREQMWKERSYFELQSMHKLNMWSETRQAEPLDSLHKEIAASKE